MKYFLALVVAIFCNFICEISAGRGYYYRKPGQHVYGDSVQEEYIRENNETSPQLFLPQFSKYRPSRVNKCASCHCGWPNANRIVGGTTVRHNKYPWICQLLYDNQFYCGATLINNKYVITAAHCTSGFRANRMAVRILQYDRNFKSQGMTRKVVQIIAHPNYNTKTLNNDIAILKLDTPIPLSENVRPACLPEANERFEKLSGIVAGWGLTEENGQVSAILREVAVPIITNAECRQTKYKAMITENMLCAGDVQKGGQDACQGDSGGPLIASTNSAYKLAGVVSFGYGCAQANAPGVYARVQRYLPWIEKETADACYCNQ